MMEITITFIDAILILLLVATLCAICYFLGRTDQVLKQIRKLLEVNDG